jgi:small-conductance mechanosensitive channel
MLDRPFRIGERIRLASGEVGDVVGIGLRATRIRTVDDNILVVPNAVIVKERVVNQSRPTREMTTRLEVPVAYGSDLARVKAILGEAALASPLVNPDRAPAVVVTRLGDGAIHLQVVFWVLDFAQQAAAASAVNERILELFSAEGVEIPLPARRVVWEPPGKTDLSRA